jgi:hypothetical protein
MQNIKTKEVKRVSNSEAEEMKASGNWRYIGKYLGQRIVEKNKADTIKERSN